MSIINTLIRLLTMAYNKEADKLDLKGAEVFNKANKEAQRAVELAKQADAAKDSSHELRALSATHMNEATALRKRGAEVAAFFSGE